MSGGPGGFMRSTIPSSPHQQYGAPHATADAVSVSRTVHRLLPGKPCDPAVLNLVAAMPSDMPTVSTIPAAGSPAAPPARRRHTTTAMLSGSVSSVQLMTGVSLRNARELQETRKKNLEDRRLQRQRHHLHKLARVDNVKPKFQQGLATWRPYRPTPPPPPRAPLTVADQEHVNRRLHYESVQHRLSMEEERAQAIEEDKRNAHRKFTSENAMYEHLQSIYYDSKNTAKKAEEAIDQQVAADRLAAKKSRMDPEALVDSVNRLYYDDINKRMERQHRLEGKYLSKGNNNSSNKETARTRSQWAETVMRLTNVD
eukprot:PhM_4_TR13006/c0_g1_i1/m.40754